MDLGLPKDRAEARPPADARQPTCSRRVLERDPDKLRAGLCIGSAEHCAELLSRYAAVDCERVLFWPLGDEAGQIERLATSVRPLIGSERG